MRNKITTQRNLILALFLMVGVFSALSGKAQSDSLIADETNATVLNSIYKVVSSNYFIPQELIKVYGDKVKTYTMKNKKDRSGSYREYTFWFPLELKDELNSFITHLERPKTASK